ncbi:lebercilin-like protein isoform X2 [Hyposmocoma kahamanoa]|uniref:lebercilin-like protein isoform X2 n=1 Tax=Hyposmocoma kahamanoa TaxID=1477025 RepID=UPI000E6D97A1|nr:lebercilin-like protein isoform X2 [Hyposmocoma kahamanoa]XP_026318650.1 lebercilin-like protein isoform X2 [Hyposmocoma kahamanoa]
MYKKESLESVYSSNSRLNLLTKRKRLSPLEMSQGKGDRYVAQRVLSAKAHRVKQLQNQLADAHYHLQELSNENKVLRAIQKKHEIALQRYENSNAELPSVLNSHSEEIRIQQAKYKQLKQQFKEVTQKLKERDMQLQQLKDEHQHLLELSKERNLPEREKLQTQVTELTAKVNQQNETINVLQRRIVLEAKNFRHQLQNEINKHKDTRHDLDLAITNADKLSTIIEMKEKMISTVASRNLKSPVKMASAANISQHHSAMPLKKSAQHEMVSSAKCGGGDDRFRQDDCSERSTVDHIARLCESSRNITSALSHDDDTSSSIEPRSRYVRSRTSSTSTRSTPPTRKSSKGSDEMLDLAKTVQEGMADLSIFEELEKNISTEDMEKKIEIMKADLMIKIKLDKEEPAMKKPSAVRRQSTEESIEEQIVEEIERPKSRGRRSSSVSFYDGGNSTAAVQENTTTTVAINDYRSGKGDEIEKFKFKETASAVEKKSGKNIDKYCNEIIQDIEKSTKVIDKHMKQLNYSKFESDKLVEQLQMVDKLNDLVSSTGDMPNGTLEELNNNFKMLTENVFSENSIPRKRSISSRRGSSKSRNDLLGDVNMTNQDLLNDLLGKN